jgi:putative SOS response-associated peptidase YedK
MDAGPSEFSEPSDPGQRFRVRQNIAPTQNVLAILQSAPASRARLTSLRWGLVPHWASDPKIGSSMINARGETVDEKPSFRTAFMKQRCLIPADGYYEWVKLADRKQPMLIERPNRELFCFAGLWEQNRSLTTCTIITTAATEAMSAIHDRMPVVINPEDYSCWLDPTFREREWLKQRLTAPEDGYFKTSPVERVSGE